MEMEKKIGKDTAFKNAIKKFIDNNKEISIVKQPKSHKPNPDAIFQCNKTLFILECSSASDRKAILGELFGAFLFFKNEGTEYLNCKFIIFLTGVAKAAPTIINTQNYLKPYLEHINNCITNFEIIYKSGILEGNVINEPMLHEILDEVISS